MVRPSPADESPFVFHLKWVSAIALATAAVASLGIVVVLFCITDDSGQDYAHVILNRSLSQQNLTPAILVFGLAMVALAALCTWLVTLHSSFRMAGPMHRFALNLRAALARPTVHPVPIRATDLLHAEAAELEASLGALRGHYASLQEAAAELRSAIAADPAAVSAAAAAAAARLQSVERRARL